MSTRRFPRTKYVRALIRMEDEMHSWASYLDSVGQFQRPARERDALANKATELRVVAAAVHRLADDIAGMPFRMRDLVARNEDPYLA